MERFFLTMMVATVGGLIGLKLKIPAGALIGAMFAVGIYNIMGRESYIPANVRIAIQIVAGAMIGLQVGKDTILGLKDMVVPAVIIIFGVVVINLVIGLLIAKFSNLDLATSLFASAPGGLTEMTLAANALGADTPKVALLQLLRLVSVITILPLILRYVLQAAARTLGGGI